VIFKIVSLVLRILFVLFLFSKPSLQQIPRRLVEVVILKELFGDGLKIILKPRHVGDRLPPFRQGLPGTKD
jgi:hypothetical protein